MCVNGYGKNGIFQMDQTLNPIHITHTNTNTLGKEAEEVTRSGNCRQELLKMAFSTQENISNRASNNCILGRKKLASTGDKRGLMQTHRYPNRNGNKRELIIKIEFKPDTLRKSYLLLPSGETGAQHPAKSAPPAHSGGFPYLRGVQVSHRS